MTKVVGLKGRWLQPLTLGSLLLVTALTPPAHTQPWGGRTPPVQNTLPDEPYAVAERGTFWRTWTRTRQLTDPLTQEIFENVDTYTELENGACYRDETGQWRDSEDLIELTATGAAAVHGPTKAVFATRLDTPGAITLVTESGEVFQSHPLGLYYRDLATGKVAPIATLQPTIGLLVPPNMVVYTNALAGLQASFVYVYAHNGFDQTLVMEEAPPAPDLLAGFNPATTRMELWTALDSWPTPQEDRAVVLKPGASPELDQVDHILFFSDAWLPVGAAFLMGEADLPTPGMPAQVRLADPSDPAKVMVGKSILTYEGQTILVESVMYTDLVPKLGSLPKTGARADAKKSSPESGHEIKYAAAPKTDDTGPLALAGMGAVPRGLAWDYTFLSGTANSYTFQTFNGANTYVITNVFSVAPGPATFQNGCVLKFCPNASLHVNGSASFPASPAGGPCLFTSRDDDGSGEVILGSNSRPSPSGGGSPALWFYYAPSVTVRYAFFRWAQTGLCFGPYNSATNFVQNSSFKDCGTGIQNSDSWQVSLGTGVTYCDVPTPINGGYTGSMTQVCQTDLYFNANISIPTGSETGTQGNPYPGSGRYDAGGYWTNYFDVFLNQALNNTLTNTSYPPCSRLVIHLLSAAFNYTTDGITMPEDPHQYYAGGLSLLGAGTNTTTLKLQDNASLIGDGKCVFMRDYPLYRNPYNQTLTGGHFFFAPFTNSDMTIDCNWAGQPAYNTESYAKQYKSGAIFMAAKSVTIQNISVKNFGAKGLDILQSSDSGTEAFPIWAATANLGQASPAITVRNCEVSGFTSVHGGYATCIMVNTHWSTNRVAGDTNIWATNAALVQNNWVHTGQSTIALGTATIVEAGQSDSVTFSNNYCDGVGLGFNSDTGGATNITIANNTFTNCFAGINLGAPGWRCGNYNGWTSISISSNQFMFLGQPHGISYFKFSSWRNDTCTLTNCGFTSITNTYTNTVWDACYAIRLAGACGSSVSITSNQCTTVPMDLWQQPSGASNQYYVIQVLGDTWPNPYLIQPSCNRDNASPTCLGNTAALCAYTYSPSDAANDFSRKWNVGGPTGLVGYWRLNDTNTTTASDSSGNGNSGTLTNGASWTSGKYGGAVGLDGVNDYVSIRNSSSLQPANVTVAAWFNASSLVGRTVVSTPYNGPPWTSPYVSWMIRINSSTNLEFDVGNGTTYSGWAIAVSALQTGQWYHVALTYNGTTLTAYLNGVSLGTRTNVTGPVGYGNRPVLLGADYGASPAYDYFSGTLDDVRVYNRALSAAEIAAVKNGAGAGSN